MNAATCLTCNTRIESRHRHDFQRCQCPDDTMIAVDGGTAHMRRAMGPHAVWIDHADAETEETTP